MSIARKLDSGSLLIDTVSTTAPTAVLLIDEDPASAHLFGRYLDRDDSQEYMLVIAESAAEGVRKCVKGKFDCVLIDFDLAETSGTKVLKKINERLGDAAPPAIILTAGNAENAATEAMRSGAFDFLAKSAVSPKALSRAIGNAVEKSRLKRTATRRRQALVEMNEKLQRKSDEVERFYQSVSHEVKTPLAAAREFVALTLDGIAGPINDRQKEYLTYAIDSCDQITAHFNDLLEMTRLDAGKVTLDLQWASIDQVLTRSLAAFSAAVEAKQLYVKLEVAPSLPEMRIDSNRVIQVLANLLSNAVKFSPLKGKITVLIKLNDDQRHIMVAVADSGCGIHEDELPKVFERLYQAKKEGEQQSEIGLGLGLSISREIVSLHGGQIWAESFLGRGSTFSFELPIQGPGPKLTE